MYHNGSQSNAARDEVAQLLSGFVKIDTSNPPGHETQAATYLKAILDKEGIASEIIEGQPGRGNLIARLKGSGTKRPILLMGHTDVVGVERDKWSFDPFGGAIKDGYVYGRGASDDKGMTSAYLEAFLLIHRSKMPLDRDIIFLAEADEEGGGPAGIDFLVKNHWDKIDSEFALNEGGWIYEKDGRVQYVGVATTEKVPRGLKLAAKGTSGHGSMPRLDNPITHLAAAVAKIGNWQPPMSKNETTRTFSIGSEKSVRQTTRGCTRSSRIRQRRPPRRKRSGAPTSCTTRCCARRSCRRSSKAGSAPM